MLQFLLAMTIVGSALLAAGVLFQSLPKIGRPGRALAERCARAPMLDVLVFVAALGPSAVAPILGGWSAFLGAVLGQLVGLELWIGCNEIVRAARHATPRPRIVRVLNRIVGTWRNHLALIVTLTALPAFLLIRVVQVVAYPWLVRFLGFPRYRHREWVNVSRHKFDGLYGQDLFWCLYCDWMTGVYALGAEMLRNVESFWCPIRFTDPDKCEHCRLDFPDIEGGWVDAGATMREVEDVLETKYGSGRREWFGHPARLTINGDSMEQREIRTRETAEAEQ